MKMRLQMAAEMADVFFLFFLIRRGWVGGGLMGLLAASFTEKSQV